MFYVITVLESSQYPKGTLPALISQTACTNYWKVNFEAANIPVLQPDDTPCLFMCSHYINNGTKNSTLTTGENRNWKLIRPLTT